jgi:CubicO group peptidase (beta-lactamase class C family)
MAGGDRPISAAARFDVSCLMKFLLSVTALQLAAEGRIDLESDIAGHLPELGEPRGILVLNLMSHASGYHGVDITDMAVRWGSKWDGFAARFRGAPQLFPPGAVFNYEHSEHVILGEVLRRITGQGPSALVHEKLLAPAGVALADAATTEAGISSHGYSPRAGYAPAKLPPFGTFWEGSLPAMTVTLADAVTAVKAVLSDAAILERLRTPLIALPEMAASEARAEKPPRHFSAACGLYDGGLLGHNGSMFGQTMGFRADPDTGAIAAAGVNAYSAHARDTVLRRVLALLAGEAADTAMAAPPPLRWQPQDIMGPLDVAALEGRYLGSYLGSLTVAQDGATLRLAVGPAGNRQVQIAIAPDEGGLAIQSRMPVSLCFQPAPDGEPMLFLGVHAYKRHH